MFNDKRFFEVNREERAFCALLAHAVLMSPSTRAALTDLLVTKGIFLDPDNLEVYVEAAALRDYWADLGDPMKYDDTTHTSRRAVLDTILANITTILSTDAAEVANVDPAVIDMHDVFWTSPEHKKLWSPGRWTRTSLDAAGLGHLWAVKLAFNSVPDLMLVSPGVIVLVEAKVESGEGKNLASGYEQYQNLATVARLLHHLLPDSPIVEYRTLTLRGGPEDLTWAEVVDMLDVNEVDSFTVTAMHRLDGYA